MWKGWRQSLSIVLPMTILSQRATMSPSWHSEKDRNLWNVSKPCAEMISSKNNRITISDAYNNLCKCLSTEVPIGIVSINGEAPVYHLHGPADCFVYEPSTPIRISKRFCRVLDDHCRAKQRRIWMTFERNRRAKMVPRYVKYQVPHTTLNSLVHIMMNFFRKIRGISTQGLWW
jgi:hypothetical protein